ncbi:Uridine-cytidine kinase 2, partial [Dimargaris xerosporica]
MAQPFDLTSSPTLVPFHLDGDLTALTLGHTPSDSLTLSQIPFIVGVAGGRASGKRSMCMALYEQIRHQPYMQNHHVLVLCQDDFYRNLTDREREFALQGRLNMDHPDAFDFDYLEKVLSAIRQGEPVQLPEWDPVTFTR